MAYSETVKAPYCTDEEVNRLRDLWRPAVQAGYVPPVRYERDPDTDEGEFAPVYRPDDYDTRQASLWTTEPMYVIPPHIARPLTELVDETFEPEHFDSWGGDRQRQIIHGAGRFMQRFFHGGRGDDIASIVAGQIAAHVPPNRSWAINSNVMSVNFDEKGPNYTSVSPIPDPFIPELTLAAPILERRIPHIEETVPYYQSGRYWDRFDDNGNRTSPDLFSPVQQTRSREGILGWTIPISEREGRFAGSLLLANNHLVNVSWYTFPGENLRLRFRYPMLSRAGGVALRAAIAELEPNLPEGTNYDDIYSYIPRLGEKDSWRDVWANTSLHGRYGNPLPRSGTQVLS